MRPDARTLSLWRGGLAAVLAFDALALAARTVVGVGRYTAPLVPGIGSALVSHPAAVVTLGLAGAGAVVAALRPRAHPAWGLAAIAPIALLHHAMAVEYGVYHQGFYHAGAAFLGWLCGRTYARALGHDPAAGDGALLATERLGAAGALGMFAATYLNAAISKLSSTGAGWADGDTLRMMIAAHLRGGFEAPWARFAWRVVADDGLARGLSTAALGVEILAVLLLAGPRARAVVGTLLAGLHLGIWLTTSIRFMEAGFLDLLFGLPWVAAAVRFGLLPVATGEDPEPAVDPRRALRVACGAWSVVAVIVGLLWALPVRPRGHPVSGDQDLDPGACRASLENSNSACSDGVDNNCNGRTDCADYDCNNSPGVTVCRGAAHGAPR